MQYDFVQVQASCGGGGLPVLADSLACLCCSWGTCLRAPVLDALSELLHDDSCGPTAHALVSTVDGGLLPWLQSGAEPHQASQHRTPPDTLSASQILNPRTFIAWQIRCQRKPFGSHAGSLGAGWTFVFLTDQHPGNLWHASRCRKRHGPPSRCRPLQSTC